MVRSLAAKPPDLAAASQPAGLTTIDLTSVAIREGVADLCKDHILLKDFLDDPVLGTDGQVYDRDVLVQNNVKRGLYRAPVFIAGSIAPLHALISTIDPHARARQAAARAEAREAYRQAPPCNVSPEDLPRELAEHPHDVHLHVRDGNLRLEQADYFGALRAFNQALLILPDEPPLLLQRAICWFHLRQFEHALQQLDAMPKDAASAANACAWRAQTLFAMGKISEAAEQAALALQSDNQNIAMWLLVTQCCLHNADLPFARRAIRHALALAPMHPQALMYDGVLLHHAKDHQAAKQQLLAALMHGPMPAKDQGALHFWLARVLRHLFDADKTVAQRYATATQVLEHLEASRQLGGWVGRGYLPQQTQARALRQLHRFEEAVAVCDDILKEAPHNFGAKRMRDAFAASAIRQ